MGKIELFQYLQLQKEKTPLEILEDKFARGDISDIDYQNKIRLMKLAKEHPKDNLQENYNKPSPSPP